jgi:hypothetical protein
VGSEDCATPSHMITDPWQSHNVGLRRVHVHSTRSESTQLNWPSRVVSGAMITPAIRFNSTQMSRRVFTSSEHFEWVESDRRSDHSDRCDSTQLVQLSWIGRYDHSHDPIQLNSTESASS